MQLIETRFPDKAAVAIAAEIDRLTAERAEAREIAKKYEDRFFAAASQAAGALAEAERLRPAAEAWEMAEVANAANANRMSLIMDAAAYRSAKADWVVAQEQADAARARARAAKVTQP